MVSQNISRWTVAKGTGLHWRDSGAGRPMVFLHGMADSHRSFEPLASAFGDRRRLLLDLPGHGLSERPIAPYTPEWYGEVVGAWWEELGLEDVDLVAHSYGGAIAQLLLLTHRERVRSVTLIAPGGLGPEVSLGLRLLTLPGAEHVVAPFLGVGMRMVLGGLGATPEHAAYSAWLGNRPGSARALTQTARAVIDLSGQTRQVSERAEEVHGLPPTALLWGDRDPIIPVRQVEDVRRWIPNVDVRLYSRARHWPHLERPNDVIHDLRELLEREDRRRVEVCFDAIPKRRPSWFYRAGRWLRAAPGRIAAWWRRLFRPRAALPAGT